MGVTFRANIRWPENDLLFPADWFGVRPPHGLDLSHVRAPTFPGRKPAASAAPAELNGMRLPGEMEAAFGQPGL